MRPPARTSAGVVQMRGIVGALWALALMQLCPSSRAATLDVHALTLEGHALAGAVVTVQSLDPPTRHAAPQRAVMDQINLAFEPDLLVIPSGSTIEFPNSDSVSHQIYSFSPAKRFQLPLYHGKPYPPVVFEQPGIVTLGCNIHDQMLAYVVVTDAAYFGRADSSGLWSAEVSHGRYRVTIWHPRAREDAAGLQQELSVNDADHANLTLRLTKAMWPAPLADRPHSWDY
jgi:plastocyanin